MGERKLWGSSAVDNTTLANFRKNLCSIICLPVVDGFVVGVVGHSRGEGGLHCRQLAYVKMEIKIRF